MSRQGLLTGRAEVACLAAAAASPAAAAVDGTAAGQRAAAAAAAAAGQASRCEPQKVRQACCRRLVPQLPAGPGQHLSMQGARLTISS